MKLTVYTVLAFYICLNVSLYLVGQFHVFPQMEQPPYVTPQAIETKLISSFISAAIAWGLTAAIVGSLLYGGLAGLLIFALQFFLGGDSILYWGLYGLPEFLSQTAAAMGINSVQVGVLTGSLVGLFSLIWLWFLLGLVSGRYMET